MNDLPLLLVAIAGLAVGTYLFRFVGPLFAEPDRNKASDGTDEGATSDESAGKPGRRRRAAWLDSLMSRGAVVLLVAVVATTALTEGQDFAGVARPAGVLAGGVLA